MVARLDSVRLLNPLLIALFDHSLERLYLLHVLVRPDDVLEVLEQTRLVLVLSLGPHERDLLDFTLEDQEAIVVQVDAFGLEQRDDSLVVADDVVEEVLGL